jgi:hypothetical protein
VSQVDPVSGVPADAPVSGAGGATSGDVSADRPAGGPHVSSPHLTTAHLSTAHLRVAPVSSEPAGTAFEDAGASPAEAPVSGFAVDSPVSPAVDWPYAAATPEDADGTDAGPFLAAPARRPPLPPLRAPRPAPTPPPNVPRPRHPVPGEPGQAAAAGWAPPPRPYFVGPMPGSGPGVHGHAGQVIAAQATSPPFTAPRPTGARFTAAPTAGTPFGGAGPALSGPPPRGYAALQPHRPLNNAAVASMIVSLASFVTFPLLGLLGVYLGNKAREEIKARDEDGEGMATAGIVAGWMSTGLFLVTLVFLTLLIGIMLGAAAFGD